MSSQRFTHEGWFGICPVYIGDLDTDCPALTLRPENIFTTVLYYLSEYGFKAFFTLASVVNPSWQPRFPIRVTEQLLVPFEEHWNDE